MNIIYYCKTESKVKDSGPLIRRALALYIADSGLDPGQLNKRGATDIEIDERGKPRFKNLDLEFSVSNSGSYWMVLFSPDPCGVDIQERRDTNYKSVASRFYSPSEIRLVERDGVDSFFGIWTAREAYGKMTGIGFHCNPPSFVDDSLCMVNSLEYGGRNYSLEPMDDFPGYYAAYCVVGDSPAVCEIFFDEEEEREKIIGEVFNAAVRRLGRGDISEKSMAEYLRKKKYLADDINTVIEKLKSSGYLDDVRYGKLFFRYVKSKGWSFERGKRELRAKGLTSSDIEASFNDYLDEEEDLITDEDSALDVARRLISDSDFDDNGRMTEKAKGRLVRRLYSYGYSTDLIFRTIREIEDELVNEN